MSKKVMKSAVTAQFKVVQQVEGDSPWFHQMSKGEVRCHESHPTLKLGGGTLLGASCLDPRDGFDVYVGLDHGMHRRHYGYPWEESSPVIEIYYPITDGCAPKDPVQFGKMVAWLAEQLAAGKSLHAGCIGGHGRTGLLLAALVRVILGDAKAGDWVRENYCKSAIETEAQTAFLETHFGVVPVQGSKVGLFGPKGSEFDHTGPKVSRFNPLSSRSFWNTTWVRT